MHHNYHFLYNMLSYFAVIIQVIKQNNEYNWAFLSNMSRG